MVFKCQKWLKPWHEKKTKLLWCMGSYSTCWSPGTAHLDLRSVSVSCGIAGYPIHGVWPHTPHNHLVFSLISKVELCVCLCLFATEDSFIFMARNQPQAFKTTSSIVCLWFCTVIVTVIVLGIYPIHVDRSLRNIWAFSRYKVFHNACK